MHVKGSSHRCEVAGVYKGPRARDSENGGGGTLETSGINSECVSTILVKYSQVLGFRVQDKGRIKVSPR